MVRCSMSVNDLFQFGVPLLIALYRRYEILSGIVCEHNLKASTKHFQHIDLFVSILLSVILNSLQV